MEYLPLGGAQEVGASCGLLTIDGHRLLIDAGIRPTSAPGAARTPDLEPLRDAPPDAILVTHAHIDHTGALPLVAALFPDIPIYATESTVALMRLLLADSARIMEAEQLQPDGEVPLYDQAMVDALLERVIPVGFERPFRPLPDAPVTVRYLHAGHILGAGMILFETPEGRLLHTGDISVTNQRTLLGVALQDVPQADVVICEGTYGNRQHAARREQERALVETVHEGVARGGRVLIPAFAVGRAQEVVLILRAFRASGQLAPVPIFLDGMIRSANDVYQGQSHDLTPKLQNWLRNARRPLFDDVDLSIFRVTQGRREALLNNEQPAVIISTSGMLTGGPAPLYARRLAAQERNRIVFTGYQDEESPGAALLNAQQGDTLRLDGRPVPLHCQIEKYGLSAHADAAEIQHLLTKVDPRLVVLVHGDPTALEALARRCKGMRVVVPAVGEAVPLSTGRSEGAAVPPVPTPAAPAPVDDLPEPTAAALYDALGEAQAIPRPWTAVELGRQFYGPRYTPALRPRVEEALGHFRPWFRRKRLGAQWVYVPQGAEQVAQQQRVLERRAGLEAGDVVLVQAQGGKPRVALILADEPEGQSYAIVAEGWKARQVPAPYIRIVPDVQRPDLLDQEPGAIKEQLSAWRREVEALPVDQLRLWAELADDDAPQPFAALAAEATETPEARLALGLDLLQRGSALWETEGDRWRPRARGDAERALGSFLSHHLTLVGQPGARVCHRNGQVGTLTGRSRWGAVEVEWDEGRTDFCRDKFLSLVEDDEA